MSSNITDGMDIRTSGYPRDLSYGNRMYEAYGTVDSHTNHRFFCNNIYSYPGQSGSPLFDLNYNVHGILSTVTANYETHVRRIDATMINFLIKKGYI